MVLASIVLLDYPLGHLFALGGRVPGEGTLPQHDPPPAACSSTPVSPASPCSAHATRWCAARLAKITQRLTNLGQGGSRWTEPPPASSKSGQEFSLAEAEEALLIWPNL